MATVADEALAIRGAGWRLARRDPRPIGDGRADQVGKPLQNIDADGPSAADPEAGGAVKARSRSRDRPESMCARNSQDGRSRRCRAGRGRRSAAPRAGPRASAAPASEAPAGRGDRRRSGSRPAAARRGRPGRGCAPRCSTFARSSTPSASAIWKAMPRASPVSSGRLLELHHRPEKAHDLGLEPRPRAASRPCRARIR